MRLAAQTQLGPYEIVAPLGAGGMGEVYRARDPRLGREVAIKVLPEEVAGDPERLRRFESEARATGALHHPNVLTVFDVGSDGGRAYLVTELLRGESLREKLRGGPLPAKRALEIAIQIARGLIAAHEAGIVHRDLKPENLFVTNEGPVKILDFGLARIERAELSAASLAEAATLIETQAGMLLGTIGYMAPEQVLGQPADARSDLFAFGVVLFELVSGTNPFRRASSVETLNAILKEEPPSLTAPLSTFDSSLAHVLAHCLEKRRQERFQSARDLLFALETLSRAPAAATAVAPRSTRPLWWAGAAIVLVALAVAILRMPGATDSTARSELPSWSGDLLVQGPTIAYGPRISPDGTTVAFQMLVDGITQVAIVRPGSPATSVLTHASDRGPVLYLCWAADGSRIYFSRGSEPMVAYSVPALGGEERVVLEDAGHLDSFPDGSLLVEHQEGDGSIRHIRFSPTEGRRELFGPKFESLHGFTLGGGSPVFPDGREIVHLGVLSEEASAGAQLALYVVDVASGRTRHLASDLYFGSLNDTVPPVLALSPSGAEILSVVVRGDLRWIVGIPRDGGEPRFILPLTQSPWFLDQGSDGSLYLNLIEVTGQVLRFPAAGGIPERLARTVGRQGGVDTTVLELPDGRVLFPSSTPAKSTLLVAAPGQPSRPFVESGESTWAPTSLLGADRVAFLIGPATAQAIATATIDGRIVSHFPLGEAGRGGGVTGLVGSPDGKLLYLAAGDALWSLSATDGALRRIGAGSTLAIEAESGDLLFQVSDKESGPRLMRLPVQGGAPQPLLVRWKDPWIPTLLGSRAARRDAGVLVTVGPLNSWFFAPALANLRSGEVKRIPLLFEGDVWAPNWGRGESIFAVGHEYQTEIWRFRPETP